MVKSVVKMGSPDASKKKVANLRVTDLRLQLEKRGLDQKGVKAILVERLQKALEENGEDPNEIVIETISNTPKGGSAKKPPTRKRVSKGKSGDEDSEYDAEEDGMDVGGFEEGDISGMVVDEVTDDMEPSQDDISKMDDVDLAIILGTNEEEEDDDVLNISLEEDQLFTEEESEGFTLESEKASSNQEEKMEDSDSTEQKAGSTEEAGADVTSVFDTSVESKGEGSESLVVHVDEPFLSELDAELAESTTPKKSADNRDKDVSKTETDKQGDNKMTKGDEVVVKEKGESETTEKSNKSETGDAKKDETKGDEKGAPTSKAATTATPGKDSSSSDKKGTSSSSTAGAANSRSKSSSSSGRSPTSKDDKERRGSGSRPSSSSSSTSGRNLWVSNLSRNTRAADLKASFSKYGKVVGAKVVTNARGPRAFCYGFVSMSSSSEAAKAINHLHRTELHGRTIHVERARSNMIPVSTSSMSGRKVETLPEKKDSKDRVEKKPIDKPETTKDVKTDSETAVKKEVKAGSPERKDDKATSEKKEEEAAKEDEKANEDKKDDGTPVEDATKKTDGDDKQDESSTATKKEDSSPTKKDDDTEKSPSNSRSTSAAKSTATGDREKPDAKDKEGTDILSLEKIKEQRLRERRRKRERDMREMERRRDRERQDSIRREREVIRRRQREEEEKLRREREQLHLEQQRLERERLERQRIEWERLKLQQERENLQRDIEQQRQMEFQIRMAAERQANLKRSLDTRNMAPREVDPYVGDQKRRAQVGVPQGRGDFGNIGNNRGPAIAISTHVVNTERQPDRINRRDSRQGETGPRRDNNPQQINKFTAPQNRPRDDGKRHNEQGRREETRRDDTRQQRSQNRNEPARRDDQPRRSGPQPPQQQRREDGGQKRGGDNYRREDGIKRRDQPDRRTEAQQRQPARTEQPRRDSRDANTRDDRRGQQQNQSDRYQGQGQSRGGGQTQYGNRDGSHQSNVRDGHRERDRDGGDRERPRDASHQAQQRMPTHGHGGDSRENWKGNRDGGTSGTSSRSSGGHNTDWKSNQRGGDRSYDRDNRTQNYDRGQQGNNWNNSGRSGGGRDDNMMRGSDQPNHRGSLLGTPPVQDTANWAQGNLDSQMNRGSGSLVLPGSSHISTLMNPSQPISSLLNTPAMSGPFITGGSVSGGLGGGVGMMQPVSMVGGSSGGGSSYIGNQMPVGGGSGSGGSMDRHRQSQSDGRFGVRRY